MDKIWDKNPSKSEVNKDMKINVMDKIWDRNPSKSEVIGRCEGEEKNEWSRSRSRTLKKKKNSHSDPAHLPVKNSVEF